MPFYFSLHMSIKIPFTHSVLELVKVLRKSGQATRYGRQTVSGCGTSGLVNCGCGAVWLTDTCGTLPLPLVKLTFLFECIMRCFLFDTLVIW